MNINSCSFCSIGQGQEDAQVVYEDVDTVAFFPLHPATPGHTLLIPRAHFPDMFSLDEEAATSLARATLKVARGIREALNPEGMNMINSAGEAASQTVFHVHVHLVPRWHGDRIGNIWPPKRDLDYQVEEGLAERIRAYLH
ncbi:HIT family protein [Microbispora bryophytorum]|uniref:HIT family protein n=1 Tax=Microbispora bryophytorum TaxID=1460882 RepID=UPI0033F6889F